MAKIFYVTDSMGASPRYPLLANEGDDQAIQLDCSSWAEDNGTVTGVTWTTEYGNAAVDGSSLTDNVESARVATASSGKSSLKAVITDGTHTKAVFFNVHCVDPSDEFVNDYGMVNYG